MVNHQFLEFNPFHRNPGGLNLFSKILEPTLGECGRSSVPQGRVMGAQMQSTDHGPGR